MHFRLTCCVLLALSVGQPSIGLSEQTDLGALVCGDTDFAPSAYRLGITPFATLPLDEGLTPDVITAVRVEEFTLIGAMGRTTRQNLFLVNEAGALVDRTSVDAVLRAHLGLSLDLSNAFHGGLRGIAGHPDFANNGQIYLSAMVGPKDLPSADNAAMSVVVALTLDVADLRAGTMTVTGAKTLLRIDLATQNHGIRQIAFDHTAPASSASAGVLYVAHGDASLSNEPDQTRREPHPFGKVLRLDPLAENIEFGPEMVFAGGLRNPHNLSFLGDGQMAIVDIGRDGFEEVNLASGGEDFGWPRREGPVAHQVGGGRPDCVYSASQFVDPAAYLRHPETEEDAPFALTGGGMIEMPGAADTALIAAEFTRGGPPLLLRRSGLREALDGNSGAITTSAPFERLEIAFDHDNNPATPALKLASFAALIEADRADIRIYRYDEARILMTSKSTATVFLGQLVLREATLEMSKEPENDG